MKLFKKIMTYILVIALALSLTSCMKSCYEYVTYENVVEYELAEIDDGIYGYYNSVASDIPAENYEMIVLCFNRSIYTLKGNVDIHYTDGEAKLIWKDVNIVHGDEFDVYVPYNTIEIRPNLTQD